MKPFPWSDRLRTCTNRFPMQRRPLETCRCRHKGDCLYGKGAQVSLEFKNSRFLHLLRRNLGLPRAMIGIAPAPMHAPCKEEPLETHQCREKDAGVTSNEKQGLKFMHDQKIYLILLKFYFNALNVLLICCWAQFSTQLYHL